MYYNRRNHADANLFTVVIIAGQLPEIRVLSDTQLLRRGKPFMLVSGTDSLMKLFWAYAPSKR